jgi:hypothetical protein
VKPIDRPVVLYIIHAHDTFGGVPQIMLSLLNSLDLDRFEPAVVLSEQATFYEQL